MRKNYLSLFLISEGCIKNNLKINFIRFPNMHNKFQMGSKFMRLQENKLTYFGVVLDEIKE